MKKTPKEDKGDSSLPSKLLMIVQLLSVLRAGKWTTKQLEERFGCSRSSIYRYLELLEQAGFCVEKDFHNRYFVITTEGDPIPDPAQLTVDEISLMHSANQADPQHPLPSSLLKKLTLNSELNIIPKLFLKAHLGKLIEQLNHAMQNEHQVILKKYHSANSKRMRNRLVEPIHFGPNLNTLMALDVEEKVCKEFKLERIGEVVETHTKFKHKDLHKPPARDIFGLTGETLTTVTLRLSTRAYLLLREEYPRAVPYITREATNRYTFTAPIASYAGIGRFVMGLIAEIKIVAPEDFKEYVNKKLGR